MNELKELKERMDTLEKDFKYLQGKFVKLCGLNLKLVEEVENTNNIVVGKYIDNEVAKIVKPEESTEESVE